jgi:hypothetical protein
LAFDFAGANGFNQSPRQKIKNFLFARLAACRGGTGESTDR